MSVMLGVDIGGTKIAVGAVDAEGGLRGEIRSFRSRKESAQALVEGLLDALREVEAGLDEQILGIGLGSAGTIDWHHGLVVESPNLPLEDYPLAQAVEDEFDLPVVLDNDANVATLAEVRVGAARGFRHVIMLTLGTGVGGGIVLDGALYRGVSGSAGELGHTLVKGDDDSPCMCGRHGCLEMYASGTALERFAREIVEGRRLRPVVDQGPGDVSEDGDYGSALRELAEREGLSGEAVGELARNGDAAARDAVAVVAEWLGAGLANLANIFNPEMIVVGGGLGGLGELLLDPARRVMRATAIEPNGEVARVASAALLNSAGVIGAGLVAWEAFGDQA